MMVVLGNWSPLASLVRFTGHIGCHVDYGIDTDVILVHRLLYIMCDK